MSNKVVPVAPSASRYFLFSQQDWPEHQLIEVSVNNMKI